LFCEPFGFAVVWVVGESGTPLPFSASFARTNDDPYTYDWDDEPSTNPYWDQRFVYVGHDAPSMQMLSVYLSFWNQVVGKGRHRAPRPTKNDLPPSLREHYAGGFSRELVMFPKGDGVMAGRAWWDAELARGSSLEAQIRHRERYYGPGASW